MKKRGKRGMGSVFQRGKQLYIGYYATGPDGKRRKVNRRTEFVEGQTDEALALLAQIVVDKKAGRPVPISADRFTFANLADYLIEHYETYPKERNLYEAKARLKPLREFFRERKAVSIDQDAVDAYIRHRRHTRTPPISDSTIQREVSMITKAFNIAVEGKRLAVAHKFKGLGDEARQGKVRQGFFRVEDILFLLSRTDEAGDLILAEHWRHVLMFSFCTTWRTPSEVLPLTWDRVSFVEKLFVLPTSQPCSLAAFSIVRKSMRQDLRVYALSSSSRLWRHTHFSLCLPLPLPLV